MRLKRNQTMRGLDGFFGDDDSSYDNYSYADYQDNFSYPEFSEVDAPDALFTGQDETLAYASPDEYFLPSASEVTPLSQGYTVDETASGQSSVAPYVTNTDWQGAGAPSQYDQQLPPGGSTFVKDIAAGIPAAFKAITDYDLQKMQKEIELARLQRGFLPSLGGKTVKAVRPDPTNPRARIVTYTDGTEARVPVTAGASSWQVPALFALGAAGLFFVLQKRKG